MTRTATIVRKTKETKVELTLNLDGHGIASINTGVGFLDHMLTLMTSHGLMDLEVRSTGDLHIDEHHTAEDVMICFGKAIDRRWATGAVSYEPGIVMYRWMSHSLALW